ncbi:hypothetical protein ACLE20_04850 [Rhizobium sp. YIM 134829]|uniref:hypothetical protein n=1 Tax=Rhizobium sp. YIM 134829 TaxID=3390453 RepID=UPI00397D3158
MRNRYLARADTDGSWYVALLLMKETAQLDGRTFHKMTQDVATTAAYALNFLARGQTKGPQTH